MSGAPQPYACWYEDEERPPVYTDPDGQRAALRRIGLVLETAAATVNGHAARGDAAEIAAAVEKLQLERDHFRELLEQATGAKPEQLLRWLSL